jgi:hypothetical protein
LRNLKQFQIPRPARPHPDAVEQRETTETINYFIF